MVINSNHEVGWLCGMREGEKKCLQNFGWKNLWKEGLED
jgi:hypothetical protein